tara:strand:- start:993 stop:1289 length:297 start_codon:yes stop_codon:yes gene_type:complete
MSKSPDAVYLIIPLMKELGMSWSEIKKTPRHELNGLVAAMSNYNTMHSFDGYSAKEVNDMVKNKPEIRSDYSKYLEMNALYKERTGRRRKIESFHEIL